MGALHAAWAANQAASLPLLHLTAVNPFVAAALGSSGGAESANAYAMPRQLAGRPAKAGEKPTNAGGLLSGVSSFAFQGTNAHVIIQAAPIALVLLPPKVRPFRHIYMERLEVVCLHHLLAFRCYS